MFCGAKEAGSVYRPRHAQESPFYRLVERFHPEFEAVYKERYHERHGFRRPVIGTVVPRVCRPQARVCSRPLPPVPRGAFRSVFMPRPMIVPLMPPEAREGRLGQ
jgi:hypothetical protein